jgi:hypothetical protein
LNIKVTYIPDEHLIDVFIGTLKDNIQHEVRVWEPKSLENAFKVARNVESKNMAMATRMTNPNIYRENNAPSSKTPQPTKLTPQQLEERKAKGLCFNCDSKYSKGRPGISNLPSLSRQKLMTVKLFSCLSLHVLPKIINVKIFCILCKFQKTRAGALEFVIWVSIYSLN